MKISELIHKLNLKIITKEDIEDKDVKGCYISDLLSRAMSKANMGDIWITIHTNVNIVAVAALTEVACIVLPEGVQADGDTITKANEKDVIILSSDMDSYSLASAISKLI